MMSEIPQNASQSVRLLAGGEGIDLCGWEIRGRNGPILSSPREAELADELRIRLPGMIFGDSSVSLVHPYSRFRLRFDAREALRGVGPADPNIQVRAAQVWAARKSSKDFPVLENPSDWTFSTKYSGTLELPFENSAVFQGSDDLAHGLVSIDYEVLKNTDIPILYFADVLLFEDELDDNGTASYRVRMRVMNGCFFVLARFFLRIDGVLLRIHDTRYYHAFGSGLVIRECSTREDAYDKLKTKLPVSKFRDSDAVSEHLPVSYSAVENLSISEGILGA